MNALVDDDRSLVARARDGDFAAFEELVNRHERRVYTLSLSILRQTEDAEDVVQNTFLKVMDSLGKLRDDAAFGGWAKRIATNDALQILRKRRGLPTISLDAATEPDEDGHIANPEYIAEWRDNPAELAHKGEVRHLLGKAIDNLPERHRLVFIMRDVHGLSTRNTAEALSISEANAKVCLLRARLALREELTKALGDADQQMERSDDHSHEGAHGADATDLVSRYEAELREVGP